MDLRTEPKKVIVLVRRRIGERRVKDHKEVAHIPQRPVSPQGSAFRWIGTPRRAKHDMFYGSVRMK